MYVIVLDMEEGRDILDDAYLESTVAPRVAVEWHQIGINLKIPIFRLGIIKKETNYTYQQCLEMLQRWLQRGFDGDESSWPTWENMHKAMIEIGLIAAAERLEDKLKTLID